MAYKRSRDKYEPDVYVDPSTGIELDMDDPQDVTTAAQVTRLKRDGDHQGLVDLHATHPLFKTKKKHVAVKVDTRTVYIMTDSNGVESRIKDPDVIPRMQKDGFRITGTKEEDVMG
jgi:hypothetical protein|tara:strand:- start:230 stop:577 length:348 start_codon:yes stop_codon:yes gene_type:complete